MIRTIIFYPALILTVILSTIAFPYIKYLELRGKKEKRAQFVQKVTHNWAIIIMKLSGAKIIVEGLDNIPKNETVLFMANHQSNFDIPLLISSINIPKGFIAKKELESWPGISTWMKYIRCIFMDRKNIRKSAESIVQGINTLKSGYSMIIFPEGTRGKSEKGIDFKAGSFKLALKSLVPIVPISIDGSYKLLEKNGGKIKADTVKITIHEAIYTNDLSKEEIALLPSKVEKIVKDSIEVIV